MADKHFFSGVPGDSFPSGLGAASLYGSSPYAPPGLDAAAAAMQGFGMAWADLQLLPDSSSAGAGAAHFDSALTSLVSSLAHNGGDCYGAGAGGDDVAAIGDLIGRLSSICNGTSAAASASNSCYSTPLSSPPRGGYPFPGAAVAALEASGATGRLSRVASSKSLGAGATTPGMGSPDPAAETSTKVSGGGSEMRDPTPPAKGGAARKRKASGKGKAASSAMTAAAAANASPKRPKVAPDGGAGEGKDDDDGDAAAAPEPAKDYIHVRARRGQATDSHSLAERVRRERISERMKMLQSLVPGCNKITGKALMLDEIINYVQSLQRQVEFLSMKLETMSPAELDADARYHTAAMLASPHHPPPAAAFSSYAAATHPSPFVAAAFTPPLLDSCAAGPIRPGSSGWEAQDLQSLVAAVHGHDLYSPAPPLDGFHGEEEQHQMQTQQQGAAAGSHMKLERL